MWRAHGGSMKTTIMLAAFASAVAADTGLIEPHSLIVDRSLPNAQVDAQILTARRYDTFWSTGDDALARAALAPAFTDRTQPAGRPHDLAGPLAATMLTHAANPDISCDDKLIIGAGDRDI